MSGPTIRRGGVGSTSSGTFVLDAEFVLRWVVEAAARIDEQRDFLTQLDAAIGDADHGVNMQRGFTAAVATAAIVVRSIAGIAPGGGREDPHLPGGRRRRPALRHGLPPDRRDDLRGGDTRRRGAPVSAPGRPRGDPGAGRGRGRRQDDGRCVGACGRRVRTDVAGRRRDGGSGTQRRRGGQRRVSRRPCRCRRGRDGRRTWVRGASDIRIPARRRPPSSSGRSNEPSVADT